MVKRVKIAEYTKEKDKAAWAKFNAERAARKYDMRSMGSKEDTWRQIWFMI